MDVDTSDREASITKCGTKNINTRSLWTFNTPMSLVYLGVVSCITLLQSRQSEGSVKNSTYDVCKLTLVRFAKAIRFRQNVLFQHILPYVSILRPTPLVRKVQIPRYFPNKDFKPPSDSTCRKVYAAE